MHIITLFSYESFSVCFFESFSLVICRGNHSCCAALTRSIVRHLSMANITGDSAGDDVHCDHHQGVLLKVGSCIADHKGIMADPKGSKAATTADGAGVHAKNAINVAMEDLVKADRKEVEKEIEEELAEIRRRKLACFQKTHNDVVKKLDTVAASSAKVNSHLSPEELRHMVDVSVASKYGADLTQFTRVMAEDMRNTFDTLKQDLNAILPR
jgi:hypothetical protein